MTDLESVRIEAKELNELPVGKVTPTRILEMVASRPDCPDHLDQMADAAWELFDLLDAEHQERVVRSLFRRICSAWIGNRPAPERGPSFQPAVEADCLPVRPVRRGHWKSRHELAAAHSPEVAAWLKGPLGLLVNLGSGSVRRLGEMTVDELGRERDERHEKAAANKRTGDVYGKLMKLCAKHGVDRLADLPEKELTVAEDLARSLRPPSAAA